MEKDIRTWFHHQYSKRQSSDMNSNSPIAPFNQGQQNFVPTIISPTTNRVSAVETLPALKIPGLAHQETTQVKEPHGWFYCLPQFRQSFTPLFDTALKEKIPTCQYDNRKEAVTPNLGLGSAQKRFLVFDQSGDQTTLIFSSGIGAPAHRPSSWTPKPLGGNVFNGEGLGNKGNIIHHSGPTLTDEYDENHDIASSSEMREDTEELNALLFSDDDTNYDDDKDYSEDDEVTSTGHSPSTLTAYDKQDQSEEGEEEIASSADEPTKRRKLFSGGYDVPSLMDTATSVKPLEHEDDAESGCADGKSHDIGEFDSLLGDNRSRQEKIRETVSILRNIIPGGKGKDSTVVIDEAISYLISLKRKAKALGLGTL